jgi:hypothetical protein
LLRKLIGLSGIVSITAPLPGCELSEVPTIFIAVTIAFILDPHGNEKGGASKYEIKTEHF